MVLEKKKPNVAIIILNWNGKKDTIECLESVKKIKYANLQIIIVDNASIDGSQEYITKEYPEIMLIKNKENLGFTGGNNKGIACALDAGAEYIILLNNDTVVDPLLIEECLATFLNNSDVGLVGPKVVYYHNPENVWCAGGSYNPVLGRAVMYGTFSKQKDFEQEEKVGWISFCVVMIKREVFEKIGILDDDFFSSYEDLDFCMRAKTAGYTCMYSPKTIVKHKIAQDWGGLDNPLYIYYQTRNALLCMKKNRSLLGYIVFFITYFCVSIPRRGLRLFQINKKERIVYMYMGFYDFLRKKYRRGALSEKILAQMKQRKERFLWNKGKIGINARYLQRKMSGIERYILELVLHLQKVDEKQEYVLFFNKDTTIPEIPEQENFKQYVSMFPTTNRALRLLWEHLALYYELKKNNITVFHGPAFFVPVLKPKDCQYIITVHDITFKKYPETFTWATRLYYSILFPQSLRLADIIITDSISTKNDLIGSYGIRAEKIQVVYLGISNAFLNKEKSQAVYAISKKYNLPDEYFLFTGVLSPRKNIITILNAFKQIKEEEMFRKYKLVIVGRPGWLYDEIFRKVKELSLENEVLFIDYVPEEELPSFYTNAKIFLFPSLYEGFGLPILEAMACGCPVITSNVSSMPEVAGDAAVLINPASVDELVSSIKEITVNKNLRKELQKKGVEQIKKFSWEKTAVETKNIYEQQLKEVMK